jgi:hypothetical protein
MIFKLYERFISTFEARLDQVKLATLLSLVGGTIKNDTESLTFFDKILSNRERLGLEASLCLDMDVVIVKTRLNLLSDLKTKLEEAKECLQTIQSSESVAYSKYYRAVAGFRKVQFELLINFELRIYSFLTINRLLALPRSFLLLL